MAKILTTAIVADIRNKLNGSVFSKNRYGSYVRTKVTPVNPQTTAQQNVRNRLATNSQAWRGLTESQRQSWIDAAPSFPVTDIFGNTKILSGNALYVQLNNNLAALGLSAITTAPAPVAIPAITSFSLDIANSALAVEAGFAPTPVPANFAMILEATPQVSPSINFVKNKFRVVTIVDAAATSPKSFGTEYSAMFGVPVIGKKVFARVRMVSKTTGQAGIPVQAQTIVVST